MDIGHRNLDVEERFEHQLRRFRVLFHIRIVLTASSPRKMAGSATPQTASTPSEHTVKTHVAHILRKLDLRDRVQAVVLAYESGIAQTTGS